jgi:hypothetical protein
MGIGTRLGVGVMIKDHLDTLYIVYGQSRRRNIRDYVVFYIAPIIIGFVSWWCDLRITGLAEVLAGVTILTALLFGLLLQVFTMGINVAENKKYVVGDKLPILIDELRANISYACGVGLLITIILTGMAAFKSDASPPVVVVSTTGDTVSASSPSVTTALTQTSNGGETRVVVTAICITLFMHLMLTLLMILKRLRTTYRLLAK